MNPKYEWIVGVGLAVVSCIISNLGLNMQKLYHIRANQKRRLGIKETRHYVFQPLWLFGIALVIGGSVMDFTALGFAAQTIIAPIGSLTLVTNVWFAPIFNGERASRRDVFATGVILIGSAVCVMFGDHSDNETPTQEVFEFFTDASFAIYGGFMFVFIAFLYGSLHRTEFLIQHMQRSSPDISAYRRIKKLNRFLYASISGITGAQSVLFAKATSTLVRGGLGRMFSSYGSYFILIGLVVTIFGQIKWLNAGLKNYDALYMVPVFEAFWIVFSVIAGLMVFQEAQNLSAFAAVMFLVGIGITVGGVYSLSQRSGSKSEGLDKRRSLSINPPSIAPPIEDNSSVPLGPIRKVQVPTRFDFSATDVETALDTQNDGQFGPIDPALDDDIDLDLDSGSESSFLSPRAMPDIEEATETAEAEDGLDGPEMESAAVLGAGDADSSAAPQPTSESNIIITTAPPPTSASLSATAQSPSAKNINLLPLFRATSDSGYSGPSDSPTSDTHLLQITSPPPHTVSVHSPVPFSDQLPTVQAPSPQPPLPPASSDPVLQQIFSDQPFATPDFFHTQGSSSQQSSSGHNSSQDR